MTASPISFSDLFTMQNMGMQPPPQYASNGMNMPVMQTPQAAPVSGPQNVQMPPDIQHIQNVVNQYQQNQSGQDTNQFLQQILSNRMPPSLQDVAQASSDTTKAYGMPELFKAQNPDQAMQQRITAQLAPYTQALGLQQNQSVLQRENIANNIQQQTGLPLALANMQKAQTEAQYVEPMEQAKIQALRAQSGIFNSPNGGATPGQPQLSGDAFLQQLNPQQAAQVKALAEGRMQFPAGFALKSPYWQQMISAVSQYDPNFDAVNFNARAATRKSFTSGPDANNITALNTAMGHLGTLSNDYGALANTNYPLLNAPINAIGNALHFGDIQTNTTNVAADSNAVAGELAKVFRSVGMSTSEIQDWQNKISTSAAPDQSKALINKALDLMDSRLSALGEKYNQGMGTTKQPLELLSPEAQKAYMRLRGMAQINQQPANTQSSGGSKVINFSDLPP